MTNTALGIKDPRLPDAHRHLLVHLTQAVSEGGEWRRSDTGREFRREIRGEELVLRYLISDEDEPIVYVDYGELEVEARKLAQEVQATLQKHTSRSWRVGQNKAGSIYVVKA